MSKKKNKSDANKVVKLEAKPLQLSFKDNLKKKITYFKSVDAFKFVKIDKDDEERLASCLRTVENRIQADEPTNRPADEGSGAAEGQSVADKKSKLKKRMELIKKGFLFGFNEIVKKLKDHQIVGIILAGQLTNHVQRTVLELANNQKVAVLIATNIEFYQSFFKISRISCFALLLSTQSEESIFKEFGRTFFEISKKFGDLKQGAECAIKEMPADEDSLDEEEEEKQDGQGSRELGDEKSRNEGASKQPQLSKRSNNPKKLKINHIGFDRLWMPMRSPNDKPDNEPHSFLSGGTTNKSEFNKSDDLLLISEERRDDYFPVRLYS